MIRKFRGQIIAYKTPILFAFSSIIKAFASILVSFVIGRYVSPEDLGLWTTISLVATYAVFIQGGVINGLNLELPLAYGKGEVEKAEKLAAVGQTFVVVVAFVALTVGVGISIFYPFETEKTRWGALGITFVTCFTFYQSYLLSTFRSNDSFLKLSYIQLFEALFNILTLIFIVYYAFYGMILKAVIVLVVSVILLHINRPIRAAFSWDRERFFHLSKVGLPIFGLFLVEIFSISLDKIWLIQFSTLKNVGLYAFALYAMTMISLLSASIASYIYPKMTYNYGLNNDKLILWNYVKKITIGLLIIMLPIVVIGCFSIPYIIENYFLKYKLAITSFQILLVAGFFRGCSIGVNVLWSMKKWRFMVFYQVSNAIIFVVLTFISFKLYDESIEGLSTGVLSASVISFFIAIYLSYHATNK